MNKIVKIIIAFWLSTLIVFINVCNFTTAVNAVELNDSEEKVYCNATIEDDFAPDSLIVILKNKESLSCKNYTQSDFSEIVSSEVEHINKYVCADVKRIIDNALAAAVSGTVAAIEDNVDLSEYRQMISINLKDVGKDKVLEAINALEKRDDVWYVGPDYYWKTCSDQASTSYASYFEDQWAVDAIDLQSAWDAIADLELAPITVGVIDTGIDGEHEDLNNNIDSVNSCDFGNDASDDPLVDSTGHGTKVAGIIKGVCPNVNLVSLKVRNNTKGTKSSYTYNAIDYAYIKQIKILNLSMGWVVNSDSEDMRNYDKALDYVIATYPGLIICAAGNDAEDIDENDAEYDIFPQQLTYNNLLVVGASEQITNSNGSKSETKRSDSNYGKYSVDIFAPGNSISTTTAGGGRGTGGQTSMATPFVTGVAALLLSIDNTLTPQQIKDYIIDSVDDCDGNFEDLCVSDGRLNAYGALLELRNNCNHNYDYSHSANSHVSTCTICNHQETFNYALYVSSRTSSSITVKCMDCNEQIVCSHSRQYQSLGDSSHKITCNSCGIWVTDLHSKQYADPESNTEHIASCSLCDYSTVEEHNLYVIEVDEDDTLHIGCDLCSLYIMCDHNIYECQDTLTHVVDCIDCDICFTEEHKYSITNVNNSNHKFRCDVCGYAYYQSHNYYEASWDEFLEVGCTKCSLSIDCIHVEVYDYNDTGHSISCSSCGYEITGTHNFYRCVNTGSASYHTLYCWDCEYTKSVSHIFLYSSTDNELNHGVYCSDCGYLGTQSHTWVLTLGEYECMYCGQISSSTPSNPIASIPPKNDEELSE